MVRFQCECPDDNSDDDKNFAVSRISIPNRPPLPTGLSTAVSVRQDDGNGRHTLGHQGLGEQLLDRNIVLLAPSNGNPGTNVR
jgi:hypothetical protein